jgi:hypothetical protein
VCSLSHIVTLLPEGAKPHFEPFFGLRVGANDAVLLISFKVISLLFESISLASIVSQAYYTVLVLLD